MTPRGNAGPIGVRGATPADAAEILGLWKSAEATESVTDSLEEIRLVSTREQVAFLVAESDGEIVGSVIGAFDGWRGNIYRLAVRPDHRRRRVGSALVAEVEKAFARWGVRRVTALVEKEHEPAVAFWESTGYAKDPRIARYVRNLARTRS